MKYFLFVLNHFIQSFFAYLTFPMDCGLCNKNAFTMPLCTNCQKKLLSEKIENRCKTCGRELFFEKDFCTKCRQEGNSFSIFKSVHPEFMYVLQKKQLLYLWKVVNNRNMVFFFAKTVFRILQEQYPNLPLIPVPPRPNKIKQKGDTET